MIFAFTIHAGSSWNFARTVYSESFPTSQRLLSPLAQSVGSGDVIDRREAISLGAPLAILSPLLLGSQTAVAEAGKGSDFPYRVKLHVQISDNEAGTIVVEVQPEWAPLAAGRFKELVEIGFFNEARFYRTIPNYIAQFGIAGDPEMNKEWLCRTCKRLSDERPRVSNKKGTLSFASGGKDTRQTQMFINLADNGGLPNFLDNQGFAPFALVVEGMDVAAKLYAGYGLVEAASGGLVSGPSQGKAAYYGNSYLRETYPRLSYIKSAAFV